MKNNPLKDHESIEFFLVVIGIFMLCFVLFIIAMLNDNRKPKKGVVKCSRVGTIAMLVIAAAWTYLIVIKAWESDDVFMACMATAVDLVPILFAVASVNWRIDYDDSGFTYRTMFRRKHRFSYSDIVYIVYEQKAGQSGLCHMKTTRKRVHLKYDVKGMAEFVDICRRKMPDPGSSVIGDLNRPFKSEYELKKEAEAKASEMVRTSARSEEIRSLPMKGQLMAICIPVLICAVITVAALLADTAVTSRVCVITLALSATAVAEWIDNRKRFWKVMLKEGEVCAYVFGRRVQCIGWDELAETGTLDDGSHRVVYFSKMELTATEREKYWAKYVKTSCMMIVPYSDEAAAYAERAQEHIRSKAENPPNVELKASAYWVYSLILGELLVLVWINLPSLAFASGQFLQLSIISTCLYLIVIAPWAFMNLFTIHIDEEGISYRLLFIKKRICHADFKGVVIPANALGEKEYIEFCMDKVVAVTPYRETSRSPEAIRNRYDPTPRVRKDSVVKRGFVIVPYIGSVEKWLHKSYPSLIAPANNEDNV